MRITLAGAVTVLLALAALTAGSFAAGKGEPGPVYPVEIFLPDRLENLELLTRMGIDIDGVYFDRARCYVVAKEHEKLLALGFHVERIPDEAHLQWERERVAPPQAAPSAAAGSIPPSYHTYETLTSELQSIAAARPDLVRLTSLGPSVQGRELWMMKISDNPGLSEDEPAVRYIAAIHGDEVVGKEICVGLIHHLLDNYGTDSRITSLVNETEIWILPSMNPDGTALGQRYNVNGVDLNRDFPDQFTDPTDTPTGREIEVQHVMNWGYAHSVSISANFHGGSLVANYPYDGTATGQSVYSACPDDVPIVSLARSYADHNPSLFSSNSDSSFFNGVANGADWYVIRGGMQDWNYAWRGTWDITMEIGTKWPSASELPSYWDDNIESMLTYFEQVQRGVRGIVTDGATGAPLRASVKVVGNSALIYSDPDVGDYHRPLLPGTYTLEISAAGHVTEIVRDVVVPADGTAVRRDVVLQPSDADLQPSSYKILDGTSGNGFLDPGETTDMSLVLRNLGSYATNVSGILQPIGWYASVPRDYATYPAIAVGASAGSQPPHYSVSLAPETPAGNKVGFVVRWTASSRTGTSDPFFVPAGPRTCTTLNSTGGAIPVPDRSTRTSTINFTSQVEIDEVNVYVDVTHSYKSDLVVTVVSPSATPVVLHDRSGGSGSNILGWYDSQIAPAEPLARFAAEPAAGAWTLKVTDAVPANSGTLNSWKLEVCGRPLEARPPEMRLRSVTKADGTVALEWWPYPGLTSYRVYRGTDPASAASFADATSEDPNTTDTRFEDDSGLPIEFFIVTGVSPRGESPWGHYGR
ncbi:MAG: proprotein convertase P-domain-containing protein [Acidobacteria bacterium]|nr:proprotein convertase P-domain-containing protein [Acidobacteriota bacterium]